MRDMPGEFFEAVTVRGTMPYLLAEIGPYNPSMTGDESGLAELDRDLPGIDFELPDPDDPFGTEVGRYQYAVAELTDRVVGFGTVAHRVPVFADTFEASEMFVELDNADGHLSFLRSGAPWEGVRHWGMIRNRQIGNLLRVRYGALDAENNHHILPLYEGIIKGAFQSGRRVTLKALDPMSLLNTITLPGTGPTYAAKSPQYIIQDLWENYTSHDDTFGRPSINVAEFAAAEAAAPFDLTVNNTGSATLSDLPLASAMALVAKHGFGSVWIDGRRRLRFTMREVGATNAAARVHWGRNILTSACSPEDSFIKNKVSAIYGQADGTTTAVEDYRSQRRYGVRVAEIELPFISSSDEAEQFTSRYLVEFAYPLVKYTAVCDLSALAFEPGDWIGVYDPALGVHNLRFQVHAVDIDPRSRTVSVECYNTDPSAGEGGAFIVGVSTVDSGDLFL